MKIKTNQGNWSKVKQKITCKFKTKLEKKLFFFLGGGEENKNEIIRERNQELNYEPEVSFQNW